MDNSRTPGAGGIGQVPKTRPQGMNQSPLPVSGARMHNQPGGFLDNGEVVVLEVHMEREGLGTDRFDIRLGSIRELDLDAFAAAKPVAPLFMAPIDPNPALVVQKLELGPGPIGKAPGKEHIEALTDVVRTGLEFHPERPPPGDRRRQR